MDKLESKMDQSINFVREYETGYFESRFVSRSDDYFICYLSSHNGCNRGCKFCWLTQTKQFSFLPASVEDIVKQAEPVLEHGHEDYDKVHFNFMARGEPLCNPNIVDGKALIKLERWANFYGIDECQINISTIFPKTFGERRLSKSFGGTNPTFYYSYYSSLDSFRKEWMPNAIDYNSAFKMLSDYYIDTGVKSKIHYALIKGQNDSILNAQGLFSIIQGMTYVPDVNLIHYNPYGDEGEESDNIELVCEFFNKNGVKARIIPRVGYDVKASCGMFVEKK